jgi:hypothetical protein
MGDNAATNQANYGGIIPAMTFTNILYQSTTAQIDLMMDDIDNSNDSSGEGGGLNVIFDDIGGFLLSASQGAGCQQSKGYFSTLLVVGGVIAAIGISGGGAAIGLVGALISLGGAVGNMPLNVTGACG